MSQPNIEVCLSPALIEHFDLTNKNIVLSDILRATSSICTAFEWGVKEMIPVSSEEEAKAYKQKGFIVAGERDGKILDFADFGNSPFNFMNDGIRGQTIAYSTTNGTKAVRQTNGCHRLLFGAFLNFTQLCNRLLKDKRDIMLFCSGWKNHFNLEDTLFAGAVAAKLMASGAFITNCDATHAAIDLWDNAKSNLMAYSEKFSHRQRLQNLKLDDVLDYCFTFDKTKKLPFLAGEKIICSDDE
ncbi:MAG: 2-phosphosulfolactate phosphatase [Bacteroidales bacterium]|jgi:2-phosphosulfolactate phosphatase|nr:2-phosphosulfolactate phosphatase [Bacteroidales bacterium]MDD4213513.1 2-phosphosulfolactate phosphatase [Bacteroidales bacterium]